MYSVSRCNFDFDFVIFCHFLEIKRSQEYRGFITLEIDKMLAQDRIIMGESKYQAT
jgi:hypothetical protein